MSTGLLNLDWGSVPAWASTASILIAAMAYRKSAQDKKQEQATKVSSWLRTEEATKNREVKISNHSDAPVYSMTVRPGDGDEFHVDELLAGETKRFQLAPADPDEHHTRRFAAGIGLAGGAVDLVVSAKRFTHEPLSEITFRDARGRWWRRDALGNIRKSSPKEDMDTSLGIYLFNFNVATLTRVGQTGKLKFSQEKERQDLAVPSLLGAVVQKFTKKSTESRDSAQGDNSVA